MKNKKTVLMLTALAAVLAVLVVCPRIDLAVTGYFYVPGRGFPYGNNLLFNALHAVAYWGARLLGATLFISMLLAALRHKPLFGLDAKGWMFLSLGLVLGPALIANGVLKDHWGRARPADVTQFGGDSHYSPPLIPSDQCDHNCAFVSGDGAFGFYLPALAYLIASPRSRRVFWGGMALGSLFALSRIAAGAHFFSDNIYAAVIMQAVLALLHMGMYGAQKTRSHWRNWLFLSDKIKA